jgi:hypothetical protein
LGSLGPDETARCLFEIQSLDSRIRILMREIDDLSRKHQLEEIGSEVARCRNTLEEKKQDLERMRKKENKLDAEINSISARIKDEEEKLFSGTIMNPKELQGIQAEILSLKKRRDSMETEDLEILEAIDVCQLEVRKLEDELQSAEGQMNLAKEAYDRELHEKKEEVSHLELERDELKSKLDPEIVSEYERLLEEKGGLAVVRIEHGKNCGGCHIEFTSTQIDRFQHEEGIFRCDYCRRILIK